MPSSSGSLLAGRNSAPLSPKEIQRVTNIFLGLDATVSTRYEEAARTAFVVSEDEDGQDYGEIVFGPDIYPGASVTDPNSALSVDAAAAHELTHFHRWKNKRALDAPELEFIDEALTSLEAVVRYESNLSASDVRQLVGDSIQRLQMYCAATSATNLD